MIRPAAALCAAAFLVIRARAVTLSNTEPRRSTDGQILDAHDGNVLLIDGTYYWYAAGYGNCTERTGANGCSGGFVGCGFFFNHSVNLYTSTDLSTWTARGNVLPVANRMEAILFSPKVIFNALTNLYVLWYNYVTMPGELYTWAVATSPSPFGPFNTTNTTIGASFKWGYVNKTQGWWWAGVRRRMRRL